MVTLCHLTVKLVDLRNSSNTDKRITCHIFLDSCEKFFLLAENVFRIIFIHSIR